MKKQSIRKKELKDLNYDELIKRLEYDPETMVFSLYNKFVGTIYEELRRNKLKQKDLASKIGKTQSYVSQILKREIDPSLSTMIEFLLAVDLILDDILIIPKKFKSAAIKESEFSSNLEEGKWTQFANIVSFENSKAKLSRDYYKIDLEKVKEDDIAASY